MKTVYEVSELFNEGSYLLDNNRLAIRKDEQTKHIITDRSFYVRIDGDDTIFNINNGKRTTIVPDGLFRLLPSRAALDSTSRAK